MLGKDIPIYGLLGGKHTPSCRDFGVCVNLNMASFEIVCYEFLNLSDHLVGFPAVAAGSYAEP